MRQFRTDRSCRSIPFCRKRIRYSTCTMWHGDTTSTRGLETPWEEFTRASSRGSPSSSWPWTTRRSVRSSQMDLPDPERVEENAEALLGGGRRSGCSYPRSATLLRQWTHLQLSTSVGRSRLPRTRSSCSVVRGSACRARISASRSGTPASRRLVMAACRGEWGADVSRDRGGLRDARDHPVDVAPIDRLAGDRSRHQRSRRALATANLKRSEHGGR